MDIGKAFSYVFQDKNWLGKVLIGTLILMVSIPLSFILVGLLGIAIVSGYTLEVLRNVRQGSQQPLPEWRDRWGEWLVLGLKLWLVLFLWSLPAILLNIPSSIFQPLTYSGSDLVQLFSGLWIAMFGILAFVWWIIVALATPALTIRIAETEDLGSAFQFSEIYAFTRDNLGNVVIAVLLSAIVGFAAVILGSLVGTLLCIIGLGLTLPAAWFISSLISMHLYAQIGMDTSVQAQPAPVAAVEAPAAATAPDASAPASDVAVDAEAPSPAADEEPTGDAAGDEPQTPDA